MTPVTFLPTVATLVDRFDLTMQALLVDENPMLVGQVPEDARHFEITLRCGEGRTMVFLLSMTPDEGDAPELERVLLQLADECVAYEQSKNMHDPTPEQEVALARLCVNAAQVMDLLGVNGYNDFRRLIRS